MANKVKDYKWQIEHNIENTNNSIYDIQSVWEETEMDKQSAGDSGYDHSLISGLYLIRLQLF